MEAPDLPTCALEKVAIRYLIAVDSTEGELFHGRECEDETVKRGRRQVREISEDMQTADLDSRRDCGDSGKLVVGYWAVCRVTET